jgi:hypothetical protein
MDAPTGRVEFLRRFSPSGRGGVQGWSGGTQGEKEEKRIDVGEGTRKTVAALRRKDRGKKEVSIHLMS